MIRRIESAGLKAHLDLDEAPSLTQEDVRARPFQLEFPLDRKGVPLPAEIVLRLDSPGFEPKSQSKKLLVPVDRDSDVCTFLLVPRAAGELVLNLEVLMGEVLVASRSVEPRLSFPRKDSDRVGTFWSRFLWRSSLTAFVPQPARRPAKPFGRRRPKLWPRLRHPCLEPQGSKRP